MTDFQPGQNVTVPRKDGPGRITATYKAREEEDVRWDASSQTPNDRHWVQYEDGDEEGLTGLYARSEILPA